MNEDKAGGEVTWLVVDSRRVSFREYWRLAPGFASFLIASVFKLLRWRMRFPSALAREFVWIDKEGDVPDWAAALFAAAEPAMVAEGLHPVATYTTPFLGTTSTIGRVFLDNDRRIVAQLMATRSEGPPESTRCHVSCTSHTADGAVIGTGNFAAHLEIPKALRGEIVRGDASAVVRRHRKRIERANIVPVPPDGVRQRLADEHALMVAYQEQRRVYVPIEAAQLAALTGTEPPGSSESWDEDDLDEPVR